MKKEFPKPYNEIYIRAHEAAINLKFEITKEDINEGIINFSVGMSIWSFGENFKISITKDSDYKTTVEVLSDVTFKIQIFDWGKNDNNIQLFFSELSRLLKIQ